MKTKLFTLLAFCFMTANVYAIVINGINYELKKNTVAATGRVWYTASVVDFPNYSGDLMIPPFVEYLGNTYTVTSVGIHYNTEVTSITIPESVTSIGFRGCTRLKTINIPEAVTDLGDYAFNNCASLKSITIPSSIKKIGYDAFLGCDSLEFVNISDLESWCNIGFADADANPLTQTKNLYINGGKVTDLIIPEGVSRIKDYAFIKCNGFTSVSIPSSVTSIGSSAFSGCTGLKSVNIPESVTSIGSSAFSRCTGLKSVTIPESVTSIEDYAFQGCTGLKSVYISDLASWCNIDFSSAFANPLDYANDFYLNGNKITHLVIPDGVAKIKGYAFYECSSLKSVTIPESVTSIGGSAFFGCTGLTSIEIPNSVTTIGGSAFSGCRGLTSIVIPNSVTTIGSSAFSGCTGITSLFIPESVTSIGTNAFKDVNNIVYSGSAKNSPWGAKNAIADVVTEGFLLYEDSTKTKIIACSSLATGEINIPESVTAIKTDAFSGCVSISYIYIPTSVTSIGSNAFKDVNNITYLNGKNGFAYGARAVNKYADGIFVYADESKQQLISCSLGASGEIIIPEYVTVIANNAFENCAELTSVKIPNSVTSIGNDAYKGCTSLTSVTIPESVTSIGSGAFDGCTGLKSVTIPESVTSIGSFAFDGCTGLTSVYISNLTSWCNIDFSSAFANPLDYANDFYLNGNKITHLVIPDGVAQIKGYAFYGCSSLKSVTIPESVSSIGSYAFRGCTGLTSISIGSSVTSIGSHAFDACNGLTSVEIPNSVTSIGSNAFDDCKGLTSVEIPNSVTSIGSYAFYGCSSLKSVTLPDTLRKIESQVFSCCDNLTLINIPDSVTSIGKEAFAYCYNLPTLVIPSKVASIYSDAFKNVRIVKYDGNATGAPWGAINVLTDVISDEYLIYSDASKSKILSCIPEVKGHLDIPSTVTSIGAKAFYQCNDLTSVHIPNSVLSISKNAFYECENLKTVVLNSDSIAKKNYTWSATASGRFTLEDVFGTQVNEFIMGDSVKSIGNNAFKSYDDLVSVKMSDSITMIGANAFECCENLAYVKLSSSLKTIGKEAFRECTSLQGISIPDSVTSLSEGYIFYFTHLTYLILGKSVETITGVSAFKYAPLQYIISTPVVPPSCSSNVFENTNSLYSIPLYVPEESISAYSSATIWKNFKNIFPIIKAEEVFVEDVRTNPSETSVELAWPIVDNSLHYMIEIREGEELVNQLIVNAEGYVLNKMNAPSKYQQSNNFTTNGLQCTISELKPGTTYNYTITALTNFDLSPEPLQGFFTTTGTATDIDEITNDQSSVINKVMINGQILILRGDKTYTLQGQETIVP